MLGYFGSAQQPAPPPQQKPLTLIGVASLCPHDGGHCSQTDPPSRKGDCTAGKARGSHSRSPKSWTTFRFRMGWSGTAPGRRSTTSTLQRCRFASASFWRHGCLAPLPCCTPCTLDRVPVPSFGFSIHFFFFFGSLIRVGLGGAFSPPLVPVLVQ